MLSPEMLRLAPHLSHESDEDQTLQFKWLRFSLHLWDFWPELAILSQQKEKVLSEVWCDINFFTTIIGGITGPLVYRYINQEAFNDPVRAIAASGSIGVLAGVAVGDAIANSYADSKLDLENVGSTNFSPEN